MSWGTYLEPVSTAEDTFCSAALLTSLIFNSCWGTRVSGRRAANTTATYAVLLKVTNVHAGQQRARLVRVPDVLERLRAVLTCEGASAPRAVKKSWGNTYHPRR